MVIEVVGLETWLAGVLPAEMNPRWPVEGFDALSLWPAQEPPEDVFEFWNYCAYALVKKNLSWPPFMNAITDLDATRHRFSAWEREAELARWRERTAKAVFDETPPPLETVAFRLQVTPREARPQVRRGGEGSPWRPLDFVALREEDERGVLAFDPSSALLWAQVRDHWKYAERQDLRLDLEENRRFLARLLAQPALTNRLVSLDEEPLQQLPGRLHWTAAAPETEGAPYLLQLTTAEGEPITH